MKKKFAILTLIARHTLPAVLAVLVLLAAANAVIFCTNVDSGFQNLYLKFDRTDMVAAFLIAYVLMTGILCFAMQDRGGRQNYFLNRLMVSPKTLFWNHALYNSLCYVLLFIVEGLSLVGLGVWAQGAFPERFSYQTLFLICYQSDMIHSFFPLEDWFLWISNLVMILGLGICTAALPTRNRSRKTSVTTFVMGMVLPVNLFLHVEDTNALDSTTRVIVMVLSGFCIMFALSGVLGLEVDEDV